MLMSECVCNHWLGQYDIHWVAHPEGYVNADYIRATGAMIESREQRDRVLGNWLIEDTEEIDCLTWAEAQRYLEFKNGDDNRRPKHRVIINGTLWQECQNKPQLGWMFGNTTPTN